MSTASWADALPSPEHIENADGTITNISFKRSAQGKLIKVSQIVKKVTTEILVDPRIAQRKEWKRFGEEKNNKTVGPDIKTTQFDEAVNLVLGTSWKKQEEEEQHAKQKALKVTSTFKCRLCGGEHMTVKCPYKNTLGTAEKRNTALTSNESQESSADAAPASGGKYVPPKRRAAAGGDSAERAERENTSLRVSNLNTSVTEDNLRDLFSRCGMVDRVFVLKDRDTRESRGMAFVDMVTRKGAENAIEQIHGKGFRNLIISVDWAKPKK